MTDPSATHPPGSEQGTGTEIQAAARLLADGRPDEAATMLRRLAEDFPAYVTAHVLLARAHEAAGRKGEALAAWHRAYFLMPGSPLIVRRRQRLMDEHSGGGDGTLRPVATAPHPPEEVRPSDSRRTPGAGDRSAETTIHQPAKPDSLRPEPPEAIVEPPQAEQTAEPEWVPAFDEPISQEDTPEEPPPEPAAPKRHEPNPEDTGWRLLSESERDFTGEAEAVEAEITPPESTRTPLPDEATTPPPPPDAEEKRDWTPPPPPEPAGGFELSDQWVDLEPPSRDEPDEQERDFLSQSPDLDSLIEQLENAPRIQPERRERESDDEDFEDEVVTVTLARIYEAQRQFTAAAKAYERLAAEQPDRADEFRSKAAEMRRRAEQ